MANTPLVSWLAPLNRRKLARPAGKHRRQLCFATLEDRAVPAAVTYVNDNWAVQTDNGTIGVLEVGDVVVNSNDTINPGTIIRTYGIDAFGTVTGILPNSLPGSATINDALANTDTNGTIRVLEGTYDELVNVNKSISLLGAQAGVDARTRSGAESIVRGSFNGFDRSSAFYITANNVTVDGFTSRDQTNSNQFGAGIVMPSSTSGVTIRNNIISNNAIGIFAGSSATSLIERNLIDGNNTIVDGLGNPIPSGGAGVYSESTVGLTVDNNEFRNQTQNNPVLFASNTPTDAHKNLSFTNNDLHDNEFGIFTLAINGGKFESNSIKTNNGAATALTFGGGVTGVTVRFNDLSGNLKGLRVADFGFFFPTLTPNSNIVAQYNDFSNSAEYGAGVSDESSGLTNGYTGTLDLSRNWWGSISGPNSAANLGGTGEILRNDYADPIVFRPWLVYAPDSNPALPGVQLPATVTVVPGVDRNAAENNFTLLQNAIGAVATGQAINLSGTFDWRATNAAAAYTASTNTSDTGDIRGVELPDGVDDVTITSSLGNAVIQGRGDFEARVEDAFLFTDDSWDGNGGPNAVGSSNLTVEKLNIEHFESAVKMGWNNTGTYDGTKVRNNTITLAGNTDITPGYQNIAVYFTAGHHQQMVGNTVNFEADGSSTGTGLGSYGFQNATTGGTGYDGLVIDGNTFQVLGSSNGVELVYGIRENGHNDDNSSGISISNNEFLGRSGDVFDRALMLTSQTNGLVIDGNTFADVDNVLFSRNASGGTDPGDEFTFTNNVLTRVGGVDGIFLQNVTDDATPTHVVVHWNVNNTIDGETGIRGLNELSTQATHSSRALTAASDLNAVVAEGVIDQAFVDDDWTAAGRFTDPDGIGTGVGPVAYGFNGFSAIQPAMNVIAGLGTVNVAAGTYAENLHFIRSSTLAGNGPATIISPTGGTGIITNGVLNATVRDLRITGASSAFFASGVLQTLILSGLSISGNTSGGSIVDIHTVDFTAGPGNDTITADSNDFFTGDVQSISFGGSLGALILRGADGDDTFDITPSQFSGVPITVDGGSHVAGDTLNVTATGASIHGGQVTAPNVQPITFSNIETVTLNGAQALGNLTIDGTSGDDKIAISMSKDKTKVVVKLNGVQTQSVPLSGITGSLIINGLAGNDTVTIDKAVPLDAVISGGAGNDKLTGGSGNDRIDGGVDNDKINGGAGDDTLVVSDGLDVLTGGAGMDTVKGPDDLTTWLINARGAGKVNTDTRFNTVENLVGDSDNDTFAFIGGGSLAGKIDGNGGLNTLDYSGYARGVRVNLLTGESTGTSGVLNIRNANGGKANDILVGNALDNALSGNGGRDVLIGGGGVDALNGGAGDDILIGGTTSFDGSTTALLAIQKEWQGKANYATRISHLTRTTAGGANGSVALTASTLANDSSSDSLSGAEGNDWFITFAGDMTDAVAGETVTSP